MQFVRSRFRGMVLPRTQAARVSVEFWLFSPHIPRLFAALLLCIVTLATTPTQATRPPPGSLQPEYPGGDG